MQQDTIDPQLALKVTQPRVPKTLLTRSRLSSLAPAFTDKAVIVLQAAPGFGKTSLLAQWRREALQLGALAAWVTFDRSDTDCRVALTLAVAMRMASGKPSFGRACIQAASHEDGAREALTEWLAEVAAMATETVLILDEVNALPDSVVDNSVLYLLHNAPSNLKIMLASRKPIAMPVSDLLVRGLCAFIQTEDLRFQVGETMAMLKARFGARIETDSCARLHELTEGWPLGLQLAISTLERSADLRHAIDAFSVQDGDLQRYFVDCLVERLPPHHADFLVQVCFLDALAPSLCQALTRYDDCAELLALLRESTPIFASGIDNDWMRIHPLARAFLRRRFELLPEPQRQALHARAADWLAEHGLFEEAARQALKAGREEQAYTLAERCMHQIMMEGQVARVNDWAERLPPEIVRRRPGLRLPIGWALAQSTRHAEAVELVGPMVDDPALTAIERCEAAEICATAAMFADDFGRLDTIVGKLLTGLPGLPALQRAVALNQQAMLAVMRGAPVQARQLLAAFPREDGAVGAQAIGWRDWIIGGSYMWEGQLRIAAQVLRTALARAEAAVGRRGPIAITLAAALAAALWDCGEPDEAGVVLANRLDIVERLAPPSAVILAYVSAARVAAYQGDEARAFDLLANLSGLAQVNNLPRLALASLLEQMRMHAGRARANACSSLEARLDALLPSLQDGRLAALAPLLALQVDMARAYAAIGRSDWQGAQRQLAPLVPRATALHRSRDAMQLLMLQALAARHCGGDGQAMLDEANELALASGGVRLLHDAHPDLLVWRAQAAPAAAPAPAPALAPRAPAAAGRELVVSTALLTPKEREVLQLLSRNLSNKQIAQAMGVGDETIKWHMKNLFGKLYAGTRKHLLERARMLGILESAPPAP